VADSPREIPDPDAGLPVRRLVGPTALALVLVTIAGALGVWQLRAWQDRREAEARDLTQLTPLPLTDVMGPDDPFPGADVGRPVTVEGEWLPQGAFYVSGREDAGRDGLWLVVPLSVGVPTEPAIPVVLGWTEDVDPTLVPTGAGSVTGWLQPPEGNGSFDDDPSDDVVPQLRTADAIQRVDNDLYSAYVVATSPSAGLAPATLASLPEVGRFTALRNLLYAFEWWFFGAFAAFVWWRWVRDEQAVRTATAAGDAASVD
jgi:cytochrome oxidase assembly protein ShyY1